MTAFCGDNAMRSRCFVKTLEDELMREPASTLDRAVRALEGILQIVYMNRRTVVLGDKGGGWRERNGNGLAPLHQGS